MQVMQVMQVMLWNASLFCFPSECSNVGNVGNVGNVAYVDNDDNNGIFQKFKIISPGMW